MFWRLGLVVCGMAFAPAAATAQRVAIMDVDSPGALSAEAGALSLALRTHIGSRKQRIARAKVARAVADAGQLKLDRMTIKLEVAPTVIKALGATRLLLSTLERKGATLELVMVGVSSDGKRDQAAVTAPLGDYDALARAAVKEGARLVGLVSLDRPKLGSFATLAGAAAASHALATGKLKPAALALAAAPPRLGFEVRAVREISAAVIGAKGLALDLRINAALVAGDLDGARTLASGSNPVAVAGRARVQIAQLDFRKAGATLEKAKRSKHPFVVLARGALAAELGRKEEASSHYASLLGRRPYIPALAMAARLAPKALDAATESKLLESAVVVRKEHPQLASQIGMRALRAGARDAITFDLIDAYSISAAELKELRTVLESLEDDRVGLRLQVEVHVREGELTDARRVSIRALRLNPDDPRVVATAAMLEEAAAADASTGTATTDPIGSGVGASKAELPSEAKVQAITLLVADLETMLRGFTLLKPGLEAVVLVQRKGNREFFLWPLQVDAERLGNGLAGALAQAWKLPSIASAEPVGEFPTQQELARIAEDHSARGVLIYSIETEGRKARIKLVLYTGGVSVEKIDQVMDRASQHGLVYWNMTFFITTGSLLGALLLWLIFSVIRGSGTVRIELKTDPSGERPSFSVLVSKKNKCPVVTDPKAHLTSVSMAETVGRYKADNVGAVSEFERIPPGHWFVHVYGTYEKAGELRCLPESSAPARVKRNRATIVNIDLVPKESEFQVIIADEGGPAAGAELWLSTQPGKRYVADAGGKAVVFAPTGEHVLHATFRGQALTKPLSAYGSRVQTVSINMVRERRLAAVAAGLEVGGPSVEPTEIINSSGKSVMLPTATPISEADISQVPIGTSATMAPPSLAQPLGRAPRPTGEQSLTGLRRYLAGTELGRGAMGVVYRAVDQVLDRTVALKVMAKEFREHPKAAQMFQQEAKALAALNHPNVVTVFDQGRDGDEIFLVMEFVEGQTLEAILEHHGRLPLATAVGIGEQLGRGLSYAHSRRVIHRDIKPGNVFVGKDGTVKLGDFGLAKILNEVQIKKTEIKGTPLYMAPEQIRGSDIDFRADIYALGCTLYEVLSGRPPFIDGEILWHHVYTEPDPLSSHVEVPEAVNELIMRCIAKDKEQRIASADVISDVFGKIRRQL